MNFLTETLLSPILYEVKIIVTSTRSLFTIYISFFFFVRNKTKKKNYRETSTMVKSYNENVSVKLAKTFISTVHIYIHTYATIIKLIVKFYIRTAISASLWQRIKYQSTIYDEEIV